MVSSTASVTSHSSTRSTSTTGSSASSSGGGGGAPKPMPMAVMRNAHEVIRGAMLDIQAMVDQDDFEGARALWHEFHRFSDLHMKMEEGRKDCNAKGLFQLIDEHADMAAKKGQLRHQHSTLYELEEDVVDIFEKAPDIERAKDIFPIFREENERHLKEEEDILMPAIGKLMKQGVPLKKYIKSDIIAVLQEGDGDLEFFLRFGNKILERHDKVEGKPRVRVWCQAFWALATTEEWKQWSLWIQGSLSPEKYAEVNAAICAYEEEQAAKKLVKKQEKAAQALEKETPPIDNIKMKPKSLFERLSPTRLFESKQ